MPQNTGLSRDRISTVEIRTQILLQLSNEARRALGIAPLLYDARMQQVAQSHAEAMARGAYLDHIDTQGRGVGERLLDTGFQFRWAGENISAGKDRIDDVFHWWMSSEGHRANILKPEFALTGMGYSFVAVDARSFHHYWVQVFAAGF